MNLFKYFKVTIIRGILFLIPLIALFFILSKIYNFFHGYSVNLAEKLPFTKIGGVGVTGIISILLLVLVFFLAGIFMRSSPMQKLTHWIEQYILVYIPGYAYIKARSDSVLKSEGAIPWKPATVVIDDNEVICFVIDETENYCSIFMPSAPMPSTGVVCAREKSMVRYLPTSVSATILMIKQFGKGAAAEIEKLNAAEKKAVRTMDEKSG
jgi:uncharacterized membrane protein